MIKAPDEIVRNKPQNFFQDIVETSPDLIWTCDAEGRYTYLNPAWEKTLGYKIEEMLEKKFSDFQTPEMALRDMNEFKRIMQGNIVRGLETIHISKTGKEVYLVFNAKFLKNGNGEIVGTCGTAHDMTGRIMEERSRKESEEKFRSIVECSPIAKYFYRLDSDDRLILTGANPSADRIIGIRHKILIGKTIEEAFPQLASTEIPSMYRKIARGELGTQSFEIPYNDKRFSGHYEVTVFQSGANQIVVDFVDIAERKQVEKALRESEEKFRLLHENAGIAIGYYKPDGTIWSFNRLAGNNMNGAPEDFIGKSIYDLFPKQEAEVYHARIKKACLANEPVMYEDSVRLPIGTKIFLSTFAKIANAENEILGIQIISQDVTELKQALFNLSESESRFRSVFEQSPVGSVFVSLDKRFTKCNRAFCDFLGYEENELIGKEIADITYPDDIELGMKELKLIVEGKLTSFSIQKRYIRKDGKVVQGEISISLVRDATGKPLYFLPVIKDITDRKKTEEELRKYEQQLYQNQKLESLGLLAGGIAHDFNNLMGGIFGYIELACEESSEPGVENYLSKAMSTINRARALTQQLLTFAKGGAPVQEVGHLFPFVEETAKFALSGASVSCGFDIQHDLWTCCFDKNQIGQVIDNLIINAQQAMPVGGAIELAARNITLAEKEHPLLPKGNYVKISVKDSGIGIPKEMISHVFDPFFTTKAKGHGLGLATCYSIIKRHGGCIDVESEPGKGSTFKVYLPAAVELPATDIKIPDKTHRGNGIFLIMDDESVIRETIGSMLQNLGYIVVCKDNGKEAVDFFAAEMRANRKIAGMIFDLTVPGGMGGKAAIEEIRKIDAEIPAFVASGYADDPVMKNPGEYGFMASICKPFRKSELSEMLNKHIKISQ